MPFYGTVKLTDVVLAVGIEPPYPAIWASALTNAQTSLKLLWDCDVMQICNKILKVWKLQKLYNILWDRDVMQICNQFLKVWKLLKL